MNNAKKIWFNGKIIEEDKAFLSVRSHGLHYGSGAFEGIRVYSTSLGVALFRGRDHFKRLISSFEVFKVASPYTAEQLLEASYSLVKAEKIRQGYLRALMFFGEGSLAIDPQQCPVETVLMLAQIPVQTTPLKMMTSSVRRIDNAAFDVAKKVCGLYINSIRAKQEAQQKGYDEALLLSAGGKVAEASIANIFAVFEEKLITPLSGILPGITRDTVIRLAQRHKLMVEEKDIDLPRLRMAQELFTTGTATEIREVVQLDQTFFNHTPNVTTLKLKQAFKELVTNPGVDDASWFDIVC